MSRKLYVYIWAVCVVALALAAAQDWRSLGSLGADHAAGLATLVVLALVAEGQAITVRVGRNSGGSSISFLPLLTIVLLFGPAVTVGAMFVNGFVAEYLVRRKESIRANFNIGQYVLSTALAGLAYQAAGGQALLMVPNELGPTMIMDQLAPFVLFGVVFLVVNNAAVAGAITLSQNLEFRDVWGRLVGRSGTNILYDLLVGPIAIAVAALYLQVGTVGLFLAILPLFFIRHSYQTTNQLQSANRDLLKVLVKAIETRDPYTSGHSLRVSQLARGIAERLGLGPSAVDEMETAALLHDVGKIESAYMGILAKPDSLTPDERRMIQSHVTKGEELLRKLSTVPESVILAVRHHHEREDGSGYPDGLSGSAIPVAAQIIAVCDAVDAMLSDRPYRRALSVETVHKELSLCAGSQFSPRIVQALLDSQLIDEYASIMRAAAHAESGSADALLPEMPRRPRRSRAPRAEQVVSVRRT